MKNTSIGGKIVLEYLAGQFRNLPSRTLAAKIYNENKEAFKDAQSVDNIIRYYRGRNGDRNRKAADTTKIQIDYNPIGFTKSDETEYFPYIYPKEANKILCLFDVHVPYYNIVALNAACEYGYKQGVNSIFIGGDWLDFHQASDYEKDPRKRSLKDEVIDAIENLAALRKHFPDAHIFYLLGNHEERLPRYLMNKAPIIFDLEIHSFQELFPLVAGKHTSIDFNALNIHFQTCTKQIVNFGSLNVIHGHEVKSGISAPVNVARGLYLKSKTSAICGHHHQTSEHTETDLNGKLTTCWSVGCLSELHPSYLPINKWNHGCAIVEWNDEEFYVTNKRILNGKIL